MVCWQVRYLMDHTCISEVAVEVVEGVIAHLQACPHCEEWNAERCRTLHMELSPEEYAERQEVVGKVLKDVYDRRGGKP